MTVAEEWDRAFADSIGGEPHGFKILTEAEAEAADATEDGWAVFWIHGRPTGEESSR